MILGDLRAIKAKYAQLFFEIEEIMTAQKQSMNSIKTSMNSIMEMTQHLQRTCAVEVLSPTEHTVFNLVLY